jgi:hypothetical protein
MTEDLDADPEYWRMRAEETRSIADSTRDPQTKIILRGIAKAYDRLANRAELRSRNDR